MSLRVLSLKTVMGQTPIRAADYVPIRMRKYLRKAWIMVLMSVRQDRTRALSGVSAQNLQSSSSFPRFATVNDHPVGRRNTNHGPMYW